MSVLEAFLWARARTADSYKRDGQLLTEHAMLDDDGDGKGSDAPGQPGGDGALARTIFLSAANARPGPTGRPRHCARSSPARCARGDRSPRSRRRKDKIEPAKYEQDLEQLLIELARVNRAIREKQK